MATDRSLTPFHIAVQVRSIEEARRFYREVLGCTEGRSAPHWVDFNLYGHQFVCHLNPALGNQGTFHLTTIRSTAMAYRCPTAASCWR
jgi:extradiol dioxygenase family protein